MRKILFVIVTMFVVLIYSCKEKESSKAKMIWDKYENGNFKVVHQYFTDTANFKDDYYYQEFYESGQLKIQGLKNRNLRKGEWFFYYENGKLKGEMNFERDTLIGSIVMYDMNEDLKSKDRIENGRLMHNNPDVIQFIKEAYGEPERMPVWIDSLTIMLDSLNVIINKE